MLSLFPAKLQCYQRQVHSCDVNVTSIFLLMYLPAGKQIVLRPAHLHFGSIPVGAVVHRTAKLLNGSADVVRFTILRPQLPLRWAAHTPNRRRGRPLTYGALSAWMLGTVCTYFPAATFNVVGTDY